LQAICRPGFYLLGFPNRTVVLRNDLNRKMVKPAHLAWVSVYLEYDIHLAAVGGDQDLLSNQACKLIV
jgi:hypothetical protein